MFPWEVDRLRAHVATLVDDLLDRMKVNNWGWLLSTCIRLEYVHEVEPPPPAPPCRTRSYQHLR